jgi:hypothetical protein
MPKLKTFDSFQFSTRGTLLPGDRFRVSGGPIYQCADGTKLAMDERGEFVFLRYCERGAFEVARSPPASRRCVCCALGRPLDRQPIDSQFATQALPGHRQAALRTSRSIQVSTARQIRFEDFWRVMV